MNKQELEAFRGDVYAFIDGELKVEDYARYEKLLKESDEARQFYEEIVEFEMELKEMGPLQEFEPPENGWEKFQLKLDTEDSMELDITLPEYSMPERLASHFKHNFAGYGVLAAASVAIVITSGPSPSLAPQTPDHSTVSVSQKAPSRALVAKKPIETHKPKPPAFQPKFSVGKLGAQQFARMAGTASTEMSNDLIQKAEVDKLGTDLPTLKQILVNESELNAMIKVPAGDVYSDKGQKAKVASFQIDKFPVTNLEYAKFVKDSGRVSPFNWEAGSFKEIDERGFKPVTYVSWEDANAYCRWEGKKLASRAQWERAAKGSSKNAYPWGNQFSVKLANTRESGVGLVEVGQYPGNVSSFGVYDLTGNIRQWVADDYNGKELGFFAKKGQYKIMKGGSFMDSAKKSTLDTIVYGDKDTIYGNTGIRCVSSL